MSGSYTSASTWLQSILAVLCSLFLVILIVGCHENWIFTAELNTVSGAVLKSDTNHRLEIGCLPLDNVCYVDFTTPKPKPTVLLDTDLKFREVLALTIKETPIAIGHPRMGRQARSTPFVDRTIYHDSMVIRTYTAKLWRPVLYVLLGMTSLGFALLPLWQPARRWVRKRRGRCIHCGYRLCGNISGVCPECGTRVGVPVDS